jgi:hypothetical protein
MSQCHRSSGQLEKYVDSDLCSANDAGQGPRAAAPTKAPSRRSEKDLRFARSTSAQTTHVGRPQTQPPLR